MPSCAFLTIADMGDYVSDDELAAALLHERGWWVESLPWDQPADWSRFDLVVIRTTWDYHDRPQEFLDTLAAIERSGAQLWNPLSLVRWNLDKRYLRDLRRRGVPIVPTRFAGGLHSPAELSAHFAALGAPELILKPLISASAYNTYLLRQEQTADLWPELRAVFGQRPYMAQPFMPNIRSEGEYSLIYFHGRFCHAILKTPAAGDFRVQEEYGGRITAVSPPAALLAAGDRALAALDETPLYARVDLVRGETDDFLIMEFELIEPSLYLRMHPAAPARFVDALAVAGGKQSAARS
jgi:glutathione synthase/RimK-type ligase-like ATP-grasp enzyme